MWSTAFLFVGKAVEQIRADEEIEDGITEEFEPLIIGRNLCMFVEVRAVRQRPLQQFGC